MKKKGKIIIVAGMCVLASALCAFAVSLSREDAMVPTVSVIDNSVLDETGVVFPENWWELYDYIESPKGITERARIFLSKCRNTIGWIKIDGTILDEPVVLDPGSIYSKEDPLLEEYVPNSYYLDHYIDGTESRSGALFMDYRNRFGSVDSMQSDNLVIYGHNMADESMFGCLRAYRDDYSFYDESPIIELSSNYKDYQYIIFGFLITSGSYDDTDFHYWNMEDFASEDDFNFYIDNVTSKSMVDTGVDVKYGDKLLTLSTCYANEDNSRFIIVARRLRENETTIDNIERTEAYKEAKRLEEEASKAAAEAEKVSEASAEATSIADE